MSEENGNVEDEWAAALNEQAESSDGEEESAADDWAAALSEQADAKDDQASVDALVNEALNGSAVDKAEFADFSASGLESGSVGDRSLDMILDIRVTLSMEIGRTEIPIRNLLQLNQGSVVELDHLAGEPMDVLVNGTLVAHGEVVVVNERYGIRLTDVISPQERIRKLR